MDKVVGIKDKIHDRYQGHHEEHFVRDNKFTDTIIPTPMDHSVGATGSSTTGFHTS